MTAQAIAPTRLTACPSCGHDKFLDPLPEGVRYDNSLEPLIRDPARSPTSVDLSAYGRSDWRVCGRCGLIFSMLRPRFEDMLDWYRPVFEISEKRRYNTDPLPDLYLDSHEKYAEELFANLDARNVFDGVRSVLHLRCQTGEFLHLLRERLGIDDVYGVEYFEHPVARARARVGEDRIGLMEGPEPEIPYPPGSFDLILMDHVLEHAHDPRAYFAYLKTLLAPGGKIVLGDRCHTYALQSATSYRRGINFFHFQLFTISDLTRLAAATGLAVERLPDPTPRRWAVARGSFFLLCTEGETVEMTSGDVDAQFSLMATWWRKHQMLRLGRKMKMPKLMQRALGKVIDTAMPVQ